MGLSRYLAKLGALVGSDGKVPAAGLAAGAAVANVGYTPLNKAGDSMSGPLTAPGIFNSLGAASRRQVWATGGIQLANGQSIDIIRNRGGYSRAIVEVYGQTGHGSNGYLYRMFQLSRYGLDALYTSDASSYTTFSLNANANDNALRINCTSNVNYVLFVIVHYFGSETGIEFDSPAGLTKVWG
jgi:hypothetical protein